MPSSIGADFDDGSWNPDEQKFAVKLRLGRGIEMMALLEFKDKGEGFSIPPSPLGD